VVLDEPGSDVSTAVRQLATRFADQFEASETAAGRAHDGDGSKPVKTKRKRFSRTAG